MAPMPNPVGLLEQNIQAPRSVAGITRTASNEVDPETLGLTRDDKSAIWKATKALYRTGAYPAIALCIRRHGEILINRTIGHTHGNGPGEAASDRVVATPSTPFCLFSASKAITAMMIHLLEERQQINLHNPVSFYIPEFAANGKKSITVEQILTHRAGIATLKDVDVETWLDQDAMMQLICQARPTSSHREELAYHALTGGYVLGELVHRITGQNLREFMTEHVRIPMDMQYFNYGAPGGRYAEVATNYVTGMRLTFPVKQFVKRIIGMDLTTAVLASNQPSFYEHIIPASNMVATAEEASRFFQCLLDDGEYQGKRIFQPVTVERAIQESNDTKLDKMLLIPMRYSAGMMLGNTIGLYGLHTSQAFGHIGLTNNFCWADPERRITVALLTSGNPVVGSHLPALMKLLVTISGRCKNVFAH